MYLKVIATIISIELGLLLLGGVPFEITKAAHAQQGNRTDLEMRSFSGRNANGSPAFPFYVVLCSGTTNLGTCIQR